jgi:hypothetical protein
MVRECASVYCWLASVRLQEAGRSLRALCGGWFQPPTWVLESVLRRRAGAVALVGRNRRRYVVSVKVALDVGIRLVSSGRAGSTTGVALPDAADVCWFGWSTTECASLVPAAPPSIRRTATV